MSEENVETVRRQNEAWNRQDLTAWLASFHPDGELDWSRSRGPLKGVYRGPPSTAHGVDVQVQRLA